MRNSVGVLIFNFPCACIHVCACVDQGRRKGLKGGEAEIHARVSAREKFATMPPT